MQLHRVFDAREGPVISSKNQHAWNKLMNRENLSQVTGPVVIAVVSQAMATKKVDNVVDSMIKSLQ